MTRIEEIENLLWVNSEEITEMDGLTTAVTCSKFKDIAEKIAPYASEDPTLPKLIEALGWQGGTVAQALEEVRRLKAESSVDWKPMLEAVVRESQKHYDRYPSIWAKEENAPGHAHSLIGIWDSDNGPIAGKPCSWCLAWNTARKAIAKDILGA